VLTALLGGLLVPSVKGRLDRRAERFQSSLALVDSLAESLWAYWKAALRVAYYGREGPRGAADYTVALRRWDGDASWDNACQIQILVSRSKRLLPPEAHDSLDRAQQEVVDFLDREIDRLRQRATPSDWDRLYRSLMTDRRASIDAILADVVSELDLN
jgi:hypothetical protein